MKQVMTLIEDYSNALATGSFVEKEMPCLGQKEVRGMVVGDQALVLKISQGIKDKAGALTYISTLTINTVANVAVEVQKDIFGKFVKARLENNSGSPANIQIFLYVPDES